MKRKSSSSDAVETQITPHLLAREHTGFKAKAGQRAGDAEPADVESRGLMAAWLRFWFTPVDPVGLHVIRVLSGLLFAFWLLAFVGHQEAFFGLGGWFGAAAYQEAARLPGGPPVPFTWSILYLAGTDAMLLNLMYWGSVVGLLLFAAGIWPRLTAVLAWVIVVSFTANPALSYDADYLLVILAFYLMIGYLLVGQWSRPLSPAGRILGTRDGSLLALPWFRRTAQDRDPGTQSYAVNLVLRLLQVHFAIIVVTSGLHKLQFGDWWAGVAFWYPMHPPLATTFESIQTNLIQAQFYLAVLSLVQYLALAWQLCFPLFAWRTGRWRVVLLGGSVLGWIGSIVIFRLPLFGPIFVIASLSFLTPEEWRRGVNWLGGLGQWLFGGLQPAPASAAGKAAKIGM